MSLGGVIGTRAFMDDIIFQKIWLEKKFGYEGSDEENSGDDSDSDVRQLFRKKRKSAEKKVNKLVRISGNDPPEWLAVFVGVFFVAGVAGIASYQAYKLDTQNELSTVQLHFNDIAKDAPSNSIYNELLLPKDLNPKSYILYLNPNLTSKKYDGLIKITTQCLRQTSKLILHSSEHKISKVEIKPHQEEDGTINVKKTLRNIDKEMIILEINSVFKVNHVYDVFITFANRLSYDMNNGIYLSDYTDRNDRKHTMMSTDFEPSIARNAFPCFDEPEIKATFKIIVLHNKNGFKAISNMPVEQIVDFGEDKIETHFKATPEMSTYLVFFTVTEYIYKETETKRGVKVRAYAGEGRTQELDLALKVAPLSIDFYEKLFGINYMMPKMDLVPVSALLAAADETWGSIIFEETYMLFDSSTGSVGQMERVASTIAHEIAHQWFGDLVTIKWWNDLWLKESFAAYLQTLPLNKFYPSWDTKTSFYSENTSPALWYDASSYTHPIHTNIMDPKKLRSFYDTITYQKGAAIISMSEDQLGDFFFKGVKLYLKKYMHKSATANQFWEEIQKAVPKVNISSSIDLWVKQAGFPLVDVSRDDKGNLKVTQIPFRYQNASGVKDVSDALMWNIPISLKFSQNQTIHKYSLESKQGAVNIPVQLAASNQSWYKANYGASGYYRTNYDSSNWKQLLHLLKTNHTVLPAIDRANIIDDVTHLAFFNYLTLDKALDFTSYLSQEHHIVPWSTGSSLLGKLHHLFHETKLKLCIEEYFLKLIDPVIDYLNSKQTHNHVEKKLISHMLLVASAYNKKPIVDELNNIFLKWVISASKKSISPTVRAIAFNVGIVYGDKYEWEYMLNYYKTVSSLVERKLVLSALGSSKDPELLKKLINLTSDGKTILAEDKDSVYIQVCGNRYGYDFAWKQVKLEWNEIYKRNHRNPSMIKFYLQSCLSMGKTTTDLTEAKEFFGSYDFTGFKAYTGRVLEQIQHNIDIINRQSEVTSWFQMNDEKCKL